jgi:hypothetical protein
VEQYRPDNHQDQYDHNGHAVSSRQPRVDLVLVSSG